MKTKRPAAERGHSNFGWLDSWHSFSFGEYHDPAHRGFSTLRVINDDRVAPGMGFGMHPHRDMEILSYVVSGGLTHRDSLGNEKTVAAGGVQYMSAGSGVQHSEFNASKKEPVHFLQVWILPEERGFEPRYAEWKPESPVDGLVLAASPDGAGGSLAIRQDARLFIGKLGPGKTAATDLADGRAVWIQIIEGALDAGGVLLGTGDGLSITDPGKLDLSSATGAQFLLFDLSAD